MTCIYFYSVEWSESTIARKDHDLPSFIGSCLVGALMRIFTFKYNSALSAFDLDRNNKNSRNHYMEHKLCT